MVWRRLSLIGGLIAAASLGLSGQRQTGAPVGWPTYGYDAGSTRFSPLTDINTTNVSRLAPAWTYHMAPEVPAGAPARDGAAAAPGGGGRAGGGGGRRGSEATPIVINGVLYLPTPYGRVVALEADSGRAKWTYDVTGGTPTMRGVEYWAGDGTHAPMILFGTTDGRLVGLDARSGTPVTSFGVNGSVDLKAGIANGFATGQFSLSSPPKVFGNTLIVGARVQESPSLGFAGDTRAYDLRTGQLIWQFHSVPRPGEAGSDTWQGDDWKNRSGTNVWGFISVDPALGLVFLPHGSPSYDFFGGDRKGANLFGDSIVALHIETGALAWHFQGVHHDTWDYDFAAAPVLVDITRNGQRIPALVETSKQGLVYILDRRTGQPVYGMEEKAVPASDLAAEPGWPTEPFPVKPAPVGRMSFRPSEIATVTPEHEKFCREMLATEGGMRNDGPFTRYNSTLSIVFPGTLGASNWHGASYNPTLGLVFMNVIHLADVGKVVKNPDGSRTAYSRTSPWGAFGRFWNPDTYWPCQMPPWGEMVAINVNTGDVAWKVPLGKIEELEAKGVKNTGTMNMGGSIATAGGLVFIAATNDREMRAFDARTGRVLWEAKLDAGGYATPSTFQGRNGKQYVAIVAAGGGYYDRTFGDSVMAFALP